MRIKLPMLFLLHFLCADPIVKLANETTIVAPFVDESGWSTKYSLENDYVVYAYDPKQPAIQLGFLTGPTNGSITSKNPLPKDFMIDISLFFQKKSLSTLSIIFTSEKKTTDFSKPLSYDKACITFFPEKELTIGFDFQKKDGMVTELSSFQNKVNLKSKIYGKPFTLRIKSFNRVFTVQIGTGAKNKKFTEVLKSNVELTSPYISIGYNNKTKNTSNVCIYQIESHELTEKMIKFEDRKRESNWFVYIVFIAAIIGIGYYLFASSAKKVNIA